MLGYVNLENNRPGGKLPLTTRMLLRVGDVSGQLVKYMFNTIDPASETTAVIGIHVQSMLLNSYYSVGRFSVVFVSEPFLCSERAKWTLIIGFW